MSLPTSPPVRTVPPAPVPAEPVADPAAESPAPAPPGMPSPLAEAVPVTARALEPDPVPPPPAPVAASPEPAAGGVPDLAELLAAPKQDLWEGAIAVDPPADADPQPDEAPADFDQVLSAVPEDLYADAQLLPEPGGDDPYGIVESRYPSPDGLLPVDPPAVPATDTTQEQAPEPQLVEEPVAEPEPEPGTAAEPDPVAIREQPVDDLPATPVDVAPSDPKVAVVLPSPQQINAMTVPQISGLATDLDGVDNRVTNTRATVTLERMRRLVIADVPEAAGVRLRGAEIDGECEWELVEVLDADANPMTLDKALVASLDDMVYPLLRELTFSAPPLTPLDRRTIRFLGAKQVTRR